MTVHCQNCNHQWELDMPLPIALSEALKVMQRAVEDGCPKCQHAGPSGVLAGPRLADFARRRRRAQMKARAALGVQ